MKVEVKIRIPRWVKEEFLAEVVKMLGEKYGSVNVDEVRKRFNVTELEDEVYLDEKAVLKLREEAADDLTILDTRILLKLVKKKEVIDVFISFCHSLG